MLWKNLRSNAPTRPLLFSFGPLGMRVLNSSEAWWKRCPRCIRMSGLPMLIVMNLTWLTLLMLKMCRRSLFFIQMEVDVIPKWKSASSQSSWPQSWNLRTNSTKNGSKKRSRRPSETSRGTLRLFHSSFSLKGPKKAQNVSSPDASLSS